MVGGDEVENLEFKWGKKRGVGGKRKEVQFYESFTFDGVDYTLHDCVYLYKDGEPEPFIGKLIKIWEHPDKSRRIKVLWFFHRSEIQNYLDVKDTSENELFLASGEGVGLANVNPLEAIAGKCNVLCTARDSRNPQPSDEELKMADFIFYRTFDVGHCKISDKIDDKIAGVDVKFIFNRVGSHNSGISSMKVDENGIAGITTALIPKEIKEEIIEKVGMNAPETSEKEISDSKVALVKQKSSTTGKAVSGLDAGNKISMRSEVNSDSSSGQVAEVTAYAAEVGEKIKTTKGPAELDDRLSKKAKLNNFIKVSEGKNKNNLWSGLASNRNDVKASSPPVTIPEDKSKLVKDSREGVKGTSGSLKSAERVAKVPNRKLITSSSRQSTDDRKTDYCKAAIKTESCKAAVTRRPNSERSKWFKELPWDERMRTANEQGTLVLLENLDPACTSAEVEDIIWQAFNETCSAKMIQRFAWSSPYYGRALVIFKMRNAAEMVVKRLDEGCLMLPNKRPLVGSLAPPCILAKQSTIFGHLFIDKLKYQMQREMKQAVSTSHFSQPNTIEHDMAMEWLLQHEILDFQWKKLHKQQGRERRELMAQLKSK